MPNISFDIFFDQDFINVTATRGKTAPRAKPEWKVRSAPKLPPKEQPVDNSGAPKPPARAKLNQGRGVVGKPTPKATETSDSGSQTGERRKPPKLGPSKKSQSVNGAEVNGTK